jgi:hypothetical protein
MEHIEFDTVNTSEYNDFVSVNEEKRNKKAFYIICGVMVLAIGVGIYATYQQYHSYKKKPKKES